MDNAGAGLKRRAFFGIRKPRTSGGVVPILGAANRGVFLILGAADRGVVLTYTAVTDRGGGSC